MIIECVHLEFMVSGQYKQVNKQVNNQAYAYTRVQCSCSPASVHTVKTFQPLFGSRSSVPVVYVIDLIHER